MGAIRDLFKMTRGARDLQKQQREAGNIPSMGDLISHGADMVEALSMQQRERPRILAEGSPGEATIIAMGTPERGAAMFNLDMDLEVRISGRDPYRLAGTWMVPAGVVVGPGVRLAVRVDREDETKLAIDWDRAARSPEAGVAPPVGGGGAAAGPDPAAQAGYSPAPQDPIDKLERLARLRDSGAITDAEFEREKARILSA